HKNRANHPVKPVVQELRVLNITEVVHLRGPQIIEGSDLPLPCVLNAAGGNLLNILDDGATLFSLKNTFK
ncbi:MAG: hypothetical protein QXP58_00435, partial [Thermoprotei archaeon]